MAAWLDNTPTHQFRFAILSLGLTGAELWPFLASQMLDTKCQRADHTERVCPVKLELDSPGPSRIASLHRQLPKYHPGDRGTDFPATAPIAFANLGYQKDE